MSSPDRSPSAVSPARAFAFLTHDPDVPSFRYRMVPAVEQLRALGHRCDVLRFPSGHYFRRIYEIRDRLGAANVVTVVKMNLTPPEPLMLQRWSNRLAYDFDDAIYIRRPRAPGLPPGDSKWRRAKFASTCRAMDVVMAGNMTLAAAAAPHARRIEVVPTPVDVHRYRIAVADPLRPPTIVWVGRPENLDYLEMVRPALVQLSRRWNRLRLRVICSKFPDWDDVPVERVQWSPTAEVDGLAAADIGLMPLSDDEWTRGKCAFKLLQYAAAGLACVASDVGANREAVLHGSSGFLVGADNDWYGPLAALLDSPQLRADFGRRGRQHVEAGFDAAVVGRRVAELLLSIAR